MGTSSTKVADVNKRREVWKLRHLMNTVRVDYSSFSATIRSNDAPVPDQASKQWLLMSGNLQGHLLCFHIDYRYRMFREYGHKRVTIHALISEVLRDIPNVTVWRIVYET